MEIIKKNMARTAQSQGTASIPAAIVPAPAIVPEKKVEERKRARQEEADKFIAAIEKSFFDEHLKEAAIDVIKRAIEKGCRGEGDCQGTVLLGINGFYGFSAEKRSFLTLRQKAFVFNGTSVIYTDVKMKDKFVDSVEMFGKFTAFPVATYVGMMPVAQEARPPVVGATSRPMPKGVIWELPLPIVGHATYTKSDEFRNVFRYIKNSDVYNELLMTSARADAAGFGEISILLCYSNAVTPGKGSKSARNIELQISNEVCGVYNNFTRTYEVADDQLPSTGPDEQDPYRHMLVFVNPVLAPNSREGGRLTIFSSGYSALYGSDATIYKFIPHWEKDRFLSECAWVEEEDRVPSGTGIVEDF